MDAYAIFEKVCIMCIGIEKVTMVMWFVIGYQMF